jgi:hypothetical protein
VAGDFGPWQRENPGRTPLGAKYEFRNANLDHFKGIGGILSSTGKFKGVLERIEVDGETHTPDFVVDISGQRVPLETKFRAIVDGTNGETLLKPVRARVLNTTILADGGVLETPGRKGRTVKLDVTVEGGRIEDLMRLALKSEPVMTGRINFQTGFLLPPGEQDIAERLRLDGRFGLAAAQFSSPGIQDKIADLSDKGRGEPRTDTPSDRVASDFKGVFRLGGGVIQFRDLAFRVPGAGVFLNGSYGLETEALDFRGKLRLNAKLSETTTGVKSFFLRMVDPFFRDEDQTVVPIKITGTRKEPDFGLALGGGN